jgi:hypothetical protein
LHSQQTVLRTTAAFVRIDFPFAREEVASLTLVRPGLAPLVHATRKIREVTVELLEREPKGKNAFELAIRQALRQTRSTHRSFR